MIGIIFGKMLGNYVPGRLPTTEEAAYLGLPLDDVIPTVSHFNSP